METNILPEINILFIGAQTEHIMSYVFGLGSFSLRAKVDPEWLTLSPPQILARGTGSPKFRRNLSGQGNRAKGL